MNTIDHLVVARSAGIRVPTITIDAGERPTETSVYHYMDCEPTAERDEVPYEDYPHSFFPTATCKACFDLAQAEPDFTDTYTALVALSMLDMSTTLFDEVRDALIELRCGNVIGASHWTRFCSGYVLARHRLLPRDELNGDCIHLHASQLDPNDTKNGPLVRYVIDAVRDLSRRAAQEFAGTPVRNILMHGNTQPGVTQLRAVYPSPPAGVSIPSPHDSQVEALIAECPTLAEADNWKVIAWDSRLEKWTLDGSTAALDLIVGCDPKQAARELELALRAYKQTPADANFADILAAVRAAHA